MEINMPVNNSEANLYSFNEKYWDSVGRYMWERWVTIRVLSGKYDANSVSYSEEEWARLQSIFPPVLTWKRVDCIPSFAAFLESPSAKEQWSWGQNGLGKFGMPICEILGKSYQRAEEGNADRSGAADIIQTVARTQIVAIAAVLDFITTLQDPTHQGEVTSKYSYMGYTEEDGPENLSYDNLSNAATSLAMLGEVWELPTKGGPPKPRIGCYSAADLSKYVENRNLSIKWLAKVDEKLAKMAETKAKPGYAETIMKMQPGWR
jgi:hypothetical protein